MRQHYYYYPDKRIVGRDDGTITLKFLRSLIAAYVTCPLCGRPATTRTPSVDHVIPLTGGGAHTIANIQIICRSCNSKKHDDLPTHISRNRTILKSATVPDISETVFMLQEYYFDYGTERW